MFGSLAERLFTTNTLAGWVGVETMRICLLAWSGVSCSGKGAGGEEKGK